jgi:hypothetical protein
VTTLLITTFCVVIIVAARGRSDEAETGAQPLA